MRSFQSSHLIQYYRLSATSAEEARSGAKSANSTNTNCEFREVKLLRCTMDVVISSAALRSEDVQTANSTMTNCELPNSGARSRSDRGAVQLMSDRIESPVISRAFQQGPKGGLWPVIWLMWPLRKLSRCLALGYSAFQACWMLLACPGDATSQIVCNADVFLRMLQQTSWRCCG